VTIKTRIESIEKQLVGRDFCQHRWAVRHTHEGDVNINVLSVCPTCNLPRRVIVVEHVSNWRSFRDSKRARHRRTRIDPMKLQQVAA
jgi:hypothetical protein